MASLLVLQLLMATSSPEVPRGVWLIERPGWQRQESALLQALRIYTSDLRVTVSLKHNDVRGNTPAAELRVAHAQCSPKVSLVAWFADDEKGPVLRILHCSTLLLDEVPCPPRMRSENFAQTLALKIRGFLAQEPEAGIGGKTHDELSGLDAATADGGTAILRPDLTLAQLHLAEQAAATLPTHSSDWAGAPPPQLGIEIGLAYLVGTMADWAEWHQGVLARLGLALPLHSMAIELDGSLTTAVVREDRRFRVSLAEIPIGLSLSLRWLRRRWTLSCGPRVSLHIFHAETSSPDGRQGESWRIAIGLGAREEIRYDAWGRFGLTMALTNEVTLPRKEFTLAGHDLAETGLFQWTISTGAVYRFY